MKLRRLVIGYYSRPSITSTPILIINVVPGGTMPSSPVTNKITPVELQKVSRGVGSRPGITPPTPGA